MDIGSLGSARVTRAGERVPAIANFLCDLLLRGAHKIR